MVRAVMVEYRERLRTSLDQLAEVAPLRQLQAYTDHWATCIRADTEPFCVAALLAAELPTLPAPLAAAAFESVVRVAIARLSAPAKRR